MRASARLPPCLPYSILFHRDPNQVCDYTLHCCTAQPLSCFRFFHPLTALLVVALHNVSNDTDINVSGTGAQTPLFWGSLLNMVYMMCAMALVVTGAPGAGKTRKSNLSRISMAVFADVKKLNSAHASTF